MCRRFICFLAFSVLAVEAGAAQTADCAHAALMKWADEHGFRLQTVDGKELYCSKVFITGSRIPYTECGTEAELASYLFQIGSDVVFLPCNDYRR
jgi:hypothetical protein